MEFKRHEKSHRFFFCPFLNLITKRKSRLFGDCSFTMSVVNGGWRKSSKSSDHNIYYRLFQLPGWKSVAAVKNKLAHHPESDKEFGMWLYLLSISPQIRLQLDCFFRGSFFSPFFFCGSADTSRGGSVSDINLIHLHLSGVLYHRGHFCQLDKRPQNKLEKKERKRKSNNTFSDMLVTIYTTTQSGFRCRHVPSLVV